MDWRLLPELKGLRGDLKAVNQRIQALTQKPKPSRPVRVKQPGPLGRIQLKGFHRAPPGIDVAFVRQVLRIVPEAILEQIESFAFVSEVQGDDALGRTAAKPKVSEKARVHLFPSVIEFSPEELPDIYRLVVIHETGHVLFERLLNEGQRFQWGELFLQTMRQGGKYISSYASKSKREDFAECVMFYMTNPGKLLAEHPERYTMIDEIMEGLER